MTSKQKVFKIQLITLRPLCHVSDTFTFKNKKEYDLFLKGVEVGYKFKSVNVLGSDYDVLDSKSIAGEWDVYQGGLEEKPEKFIKGFKSFKDALHFIEKEGYLVLCINGREHRIYLVSTETKKIKKVPRKHLAKQTIIYW